MITDGVHGGDRKIPGDGTSEPANEELRLTQAVENYLLSIYLVEERGYRVTNSKLLDQLRRTPATEGLGTSAPSVSGMVRRMRKEGFIQISSNKSIHLTSHGKTLAERIIRRHRLAARMVVDLLGLELHRANVEAHRLEHAISDEIEERIQKTLGNPTTDPFGQPIPGSGHVSSTSTIQLDEAKAGQRLIVDRIPEEDEELVAYLAKSKLVPGTEVTVREVAPYRGVVTVQVADNTVVLGNKVAALVRLTPKQLDS